VAPAALMTPKNYAPGTDWSATMANMQRPVTSTSSTTHTTQTNYVDVGGVHVTHPGADEFQIQRAVTKGVTEALDKQVLNDLVQLQPQF
jgi:hypothetical protein